VAEITICCVKHGLRGLSPVKDLCHTACTTLGSFLEK
jgi:hypothetical protein